MILKIMAKKISIVLDSTQQELLLSALMEKTHWCRKHASSQVVRAYEMLYGDFKEAIAYGENV